MSIKWANLVKEMHEKKDFINEEDLYLSEQDRLDQELYDATKYTEIVKQRQLLMSLSETEQEAVQRWADVEELRKHFKYFPDFLYACMTQVLGFNCTDIQIDIGEFIADEDNKYIQIQAQRSQAKSTIAAIYSVWKLIMDCSHRVLIVSAGSDVAFEIAGYVIQIIMDWDILKCLRPDKQNGDRASKKAFDIHWQLKGVEKSPSVACIGITANLQGRRADTLLPDDIESSKNGQTEVQREQLAHLSRDFSSICQSGRIIYLGTPQTVDSIYNDLPARGYTVRIWTGRYPTEEQEKNYEGRLAPLLIERMKENPSLRTGGGADKKQGQPVDPVLVNEDLLTFKEVDQGVAYFQLQHMLNPKLSDDQRHPLKTKDLIVMDFDYEKGHGEITWLPDQKNLLPTNLGLSCKPTLYKPHAVSQSTFKYTGKTMFVDPSGAGSDETVAVVVYMLHGYYFLADMIAMTTANHDENYQAIAEMAAKHDVNDINIENNYGGGAFTALMHPILKRVYEKKGKQNVPRVDSPVASNTMFKEARIAGTLTGVIARHRLIIHQDVIDYDVKSLERYSVGERQSYSLLHQLSKLVIERGALKHDDRLDALAGAISVYIDRLAEDERTQTERKETKEAIDTIQNFMHNEWSSKHTEKKTQRLGNIKDRLRTNRRRRK